MQLIKDFLGNDGTVYSHCFDIKDDSTYVLLECTSQVVYKVDHSANVFDRNNKQVGQFVLNPGNVWSYKPVEGEEIRTAHVNLLKTEREVFKKLLAV